jgi:hypothetical protein
MKLKQCALSLLAAGLVAVGGNVAAANEQTENSFAALSNVEVQTLSAQEMQSVTGQAFPRLVGFLNAVADRVETNHPILGAALDSLAQKINAITLPPCP